MNKQLSTLTPEIYLDLKDKNLNDVQIAKQYGMRTLTEWKKQHNLKGIKRPINSSDYISIAPRDPWTNGAEKAPEDSPAISALREALQDKYKEIKSLQNHLNRANSALRAAEAREEHYLELLKLNSIEVT
ncbi:hypothetical protein ACWGPW_24305 [Paenibacillus chitinolyticus]